MEDKNAKDLLKKYLEGKSTPAERAIIESWYIQELDKKDNQSLHTPDYFEIEKEIWAELKPGKTPAFKLKWLQITTAAAAVLIVASFIIYFSPALRQPQAEKNYSAVKIKPGSSRARLILADGSEINLEDAQYGELAKESGVLVRKTKDGQLTYDVVPQASASQPVYNTIITPKGGQYQVNLPDGTKVWLNAASSVKFPTVFDAAKRIVEISGEVYFEVSKALTPSKSHQPFIVKSVGQTIQVLGTHFNVSAYADEEHTKTTLLEGSVYVASQARKSGMILKPGQQSILQNDTIAIANVNGEEAVAWKNGVFQFDSEEIGGIMRKISRWYDVDVVYQKDVVNQKFAGSISRFEEVSKVLRMLELTGSIHFKIEGRRVTVMP
jgi:ferric-dicitrate binding protein FerR (iron transport regulator)